MPALTFRKAVTADQPVVLDLYLEAISEMKRLRIDQWDEYYPANTACIDADIRSRNMTIAESDGQVAGVFVLDTHCDSEYKSGTWQNPEDSFLTVHRLCVHPNFQHKGTGTWIMLHIERIAREKNIRSLRLDVFCQNPYSLHMYEKLGFSKVGEVRWRKGIFFLMEKILSDSNR